MSDPGSQGPDPRKRWTEQDVETLLTSFFQSEVPAELRELADDPGVAPVVPAPAVPQRSHRGRVAASLAALAGIVLAVVFVFNGAVDDPTPQPAVVDHDPVAEELEVPLMSLQIDRYETDNGLVEQRTNVSWTNVSVYEDEAGVEMAWSVPEISIEVYGLDQ